jgi:hypothetical protein
MAGIRSWRVPMSALVGHVMMVQLLTRSPVFLSVHSSHKPAITIWFFSATATALYALAIGAHVNMCALSRCGRPKCSPGPGA